MCKINVLILFLVLQLPTVAQVVSDVKKAVVVLETNRGAISLMLYNETPLHRDNFLKQVKSGYYDGILFHRVIENFMIQCGDSTTRNALPNSRVGMYEPNYKVSAEIIFPEFYHHRGVLAAAREADDKNPERASSPTHFYIVWGKRLTEFQLDQVQSRLDIITNNKVKLTPEIRNTYFKKGGTPHLDGQYTIFGEVIDGLDVVGEIQKEVTDQFNRPLTDIKIIRAIVLEE